MPFFSIIIATYNASEFLQSTLNSIYKQECKDYEIIIIDGSSTDDTMQIIQRNKSQLAYYTSEVDEGLYDAWNKGIKVVASQWVMFLGAGDTLKSDALVSYKCFFEKFGYDFDYVSAKVMRTRQDGSNLSTYGDKWEWSSSRFFMNVAQIGRAHV